MSRPLRIEYSGACYHVINRGLEQRDIFNTSTNFQYFLELLNNLHEKYNLVVHSYCLMSNHYHLYLKTPNGNLSKIMRQLDGNYTQKFNRTFNRVGPLFQGRYKAILIDKDNYSLRLSQYVHLNPVKARLVARPEQYKWSSYLAFIGKVKKPPFLDTDWLLSQFQCCRRKAIKEFKDFVNKGINENWTPEADAYKGIILGDENFVSNIRDNFLDNSKEDKEIPQLQAVQKRITADEIIRKIATHHLESGLESKLIIYALKKYTSLTLKQIGRKTGKNHYSVVSKTVKRLLEQAKIDKKLNKLILNIEYDCKKSNVKT